jgi:hypothetical protein
MVNPMRNNWWEMPNFVEFATDNKVHLWYNTIHHPEHLGIWSLPSSDLSVIIQTLELEVDRLKPDPLTENFTALGNWEKLDHFVNKQITNWYNKQLEREKGTKNKIIKIKEVTNV